MKNRNVIDEPYIDYYKNIVSAKNNTVNKRPNTKKITLERLEDQIEIKYQHYQLKYQSHLLHEIEDSTFTGSDKTALLSAYSSKGKNIDSIRVKIKNAQPVDLQNLCPYCGILTPNSTDHYIPKDAYPEYAVLAINLVPCCIQCNGKKSEFWKNVEGRGIINYYIDSIPTNQYLFCSVRYDGNIPCVSFSISNDNGIDANLFHIINSHYTKLELLKRFEENSNDEITSTLDSIHSYTKNPSADEVSSMIKTNYDKTVQRFGINHWKCALLMELSLCEDFLLKAVTQPEYLGSE